MKKVLFAAGLLVMCSLGKAQNMNVVAVPKPGETLALKEAAHNFGKIPQGRPVTYTFDVVNTGTEPLLLDNVQASCGCTTPEWGKDAIAPGATSKIRVGYNAAAEGPFTKMITITYHGSSTKTITISGEVYKSPATSAPENASIQLLKQINQ